MYARRSFLIPLPVLVKQMRKACTPQKGPVKLIKRWEEGIWCLFPTPLPPSPEAQLTELVFGFGYWGRMAPVSGALLSILLAMASSPVPLGSFHLHFPPKASFCSPGRSFVCCVCFAQKAVCIITLLRGCVMKSEIPPNTSLPPIQLLSIPVYLPWSSPF